MYKLKLMKANRPKVAIAYEPLLSDNEVKYYCPECDESVSSLDNYCSNCGTELLWEELHKPSRKLKKILKSL